MCAKVFLLDESRERVAFRRFELAEVFAQLRRDKVKTESAVKFGLVANGRGD